jgi:hypothetical protein
MVGISMNIGMHAIEYWLPITIEPIADESLEQYPIHLQNQWQRELGRMSPLITRYFADKSIRYVFRMRYQGNMLRVWFAKEEDEAAGIRPLAEAPILKDRWVSPEVEVVSCLPMPEGFVENSPTILFSGMAQGVRIPNPRFREAILHLLQRTTIKCKSHRLLWTECMLAFKRKLHSILVF